MRRLSRLARSSPDLRLGLLLAVASFGGAACGAATRHSPPPAIDKGVDLDLPTLYSRYAPAIAQVRVVFHAESTTRVQSGSAVYLGEGQFLTTCHAFAAMEGFSREGHTVDLVIGQMTASTGVVHDDYSLPAKMIRCDDELDLAIVQATRGRLPDVALAVALTDPQPGLATVALGGSRNGLPWTIHPCSVAGLGVVRNDSMERISSVDYPRFLATEKLMFNRFVLQVSCSSYPMSGSALLNHKGELTGIMQFTAWDSTDETPQIWRFFVPASGIRKFLASKAVPSLR